MWSRALLLLCLSQPAIAGPIKLAYGVSTPAATALAHPLTIEVRIDRPADRGGDDIDRIGVLRKHLGVPQPLMAHPRKGERLKDMWTRWTLETLAAAGIQDTPGGGRIRVTVEEFWIDGYQSWGIEARVRVDVYRADGERVWTKNLRGQETRRLSTSPKKLNEPIGELMSTLSAMLIDSLRGSGAKGLERARR